MDTSVPSLASSEIESSLLQILGSLNVASKHWIIRQYDHEVQSGSALKPLVGPSCSGPGDAAVVRPRLTSQRGVVISCGMNPNYGDYDPYHMAASAIDEAVRNAVAVGADPERLAILDNFCWGNTDRPETLGTLVRAALACHDIAVAWQTPFISGKDSLNNEFAWMDQNGNKQSIAIPPSLLISAMGQVADVRKCVSMDLKETGNSLYLIGSTHREFGGSHFFQVRRLCGGLVPKVRAAEAKAIFIAVHQAIHAGTVRACHDLSEGGLAVALAEMAFAGELGITIDLAACLPNGMNATEFLFSESNSRFIIEVAQDRQSEFERLMHGVPFQRIGQVTGGDNVAIGLANESLVRLPWRKLFEAWHRPLNLS